LKVGGGKQFVKPAIARLHSIFLGRASALPLNTDSQLLKLAVSVPI